MEDVESPLFKRLLIVIFSFLPFLSLAHSLSDYEAELLTESIYSFADDEVKARLQSIDAQLVEHRFDASVRYIIRKYVVNWRGGAEDILGRAATYFPIFEKHLAEAGLPDALKYLAITESALKPQAVSRVGAQGLWQFMPETAREYGLQVDEQIDQRIDPNRATEAAIRYLQDHYNYFGDWALTLASYNAGKGGVKRAMRRSRKKTFWGIKRHLPRETRSYVPGFIAATYLAEFFAHHDLQPRLPHLDQQITTSVIVYSSCDFERIAQVTGLSVAALRALNPSYQEECIPVNTAGHYLVLPKRVVPAWEDFVALGYPTQGGDLALPVGAKPDYDILHYTVQAGDSLAYIAQKLDLSPFHLRLWNGLPGAPILIEGEDLLYYRPSGYVHFRRDVPEPVEYSLPTITHIDHYNQQINIRELPPQMHRVYYRLDKRRRPSQVVAGSSLINTNDVLAWNYLGNDKPLAAGSVLVLPRQDN